MKLVILAYWRLLLILYLLPVGIVFLLMFCNITVFGNRIELDLLKSMMAVASFILFANAKH